MSECGRVRETYHAAIQHDLVDFEGDEHLAGVVRRPTGWFRSTVDANYPELGPPESLLEETKAAQEELSLQGLCDEEAHNAAWADVDFESRYREYLTSADAVERPLRDLVDRIEAGETVVLVCFEGENKRCHRHILVEAVQARRCARLGLEPP